MYVQDWLARIFRAVLLLCCKMLFGGSVIMHTRITPSPLRRRGDVTFPLEAHYNSAGYFHDEAIVDVRNAGVGYYIEVVPIGGGS
jgi:hypothetical protein